MKYAAPHEKGPEVNINERGCQYISKKTFQMPENYCCLTDFACSKFFCTLRYIVRQRAYVIYDAIILQQTAPSKVASSTEQ